MLVDGRPVNDIAAAHDPEVIALFLRGVEKPRNPRQRHDESAAVHEIDGESVFRNADGSNAFASFRHTPSLS